MPLFSRTRTPRTTTTHTTRSAHTGLSPLFLATNALIWISAVIVMGILAYWFSRDPQPDWLVFILVTSVLTVAFFLAAFFLGAFLGYFLLFNLIFSYLWLAVVVFTASSFTYANSQQAHAVEAFSFIAFFALLFNILYSWHLGFRGEHTRTTTTSRV